jgi:hypothetical protein
MTSSHGYSRPDRSAFYAALVAPEHTCTSGPLCGQMSDFIDVMTGYADDPISREYGIYPAEPADVSECDHESCLTLIHEDCRACFTETMDTYYGGSYAARRTAS